MTAREAAEAFTDAKVKDSRDPLTSTHVPADVLSSGRCITRDREHDWALED
jgi:hypothetical protein